MIQLKKMMLVPAALFALGTFQIASAEHHEGKAAAACECKDGENCKCDGKDCKCDHGAKKAKKKKACKSCHDGEKPAEAKK